jgi:hypothetical protein
MNIDTRSAPDTLHYATHAHTPGAVYVTTLRWLGELRAKLT